MSFLRDTVKSAGAGLVMTVSRFFAMAIIARELGVAHFGILGFSIFCLDLIALFALAGLPGVTSRFMPLASLRERPVFARMIRIWLSASVTVVLAAAPLVAATVIGLKAEAIWIFAAWAVLTVAQTATLAQLQGALRFDLAAWGNACAAAVLLLGAWLFVTSGDLTSAFLVLAATVLVQFLPVLLLWSGLAKARPPRDAADGLPDRRAIMAYGLNAWLAALTTAIVWGRGEVLVIESMLSAEMLGYYGAAMTLLALVWRMTQMLQGAVAPHLSARIKSGGAELHRFVTQVNRLTLAISAGTALMLALCGQELAVIVFGEQFRRTGEVLAFLAPGAAVAGVGTVNLSVQYLSEGRFTRNAVIVAAIALLSLTAFLIPDFEILGAATARTVILIGMSASMPIWLIISGYTGIGRRVGVELLTAILTVGAASLLNLSVELPFGVRAALWFGMTYLIFARATESFVPTGMLRGGVRLLRAL